MSLKKYAIPLSITPEISHWLAGLLVAGHGGAIVLLFSLALPVVLKWFVAAGLIVNLWHVLRKQPGQPRMGNIRGLVWQAEGDWVVDVIGVGWCSAELLPSTYAHPWLVVLNFRLEEERWLRSVVLLPDAVDGDKLRRLRVRLKVETTSAHESQGS